MFIKKRILSDILFDDINYELDGKEERPAAIGSSNKDGRALEIKPEVRSAALILLDHLLFPDFNKKVEELCSEFDDKQLPQNLEVREMEYLRYGLTDHFRKHQDVGYNSNKKQPRRYTSITMLSKTDDMVGGQLSVFEEDKEHVVDLQVGETVVFYSSTWHQVTAVTKGGREVLVAWVYDKLDS